MLEAWVGLNRHSGEPRLLKVVQETILRKDTHLQGAAVSPVEHEVRESLLLPLGCDVHEPAVVCLAFNDKVVEPRVVLDRLGLEAIWHRQYEEPIRFEEQPSVLRRRAAPEGRRAQTHRTR